MVGFLLPAIAGIGTALIGANASNRAARAQTNAANAQIDSNERIFNMQRADLGGYRDAGQNALGALQFELGLGGQQEDQGVFDRIFGGNTATAPEDYQAFEGDRAYDAIYGTGPYEQSDRYNFLQNASQRAIDSSAASRGGLFSSGTLDRQQENAFGLAAQDFANWQRGQERRVAYDNDQRNNYLNRLTGLSGMGQSAAAMTANAAGNLGQGNANALANIGDANAAGAIGGFNALSNGLQNGLSTYGYLSQVGGGGGGINVGGPNSLWGSGSFWG